jgi:hypothetical protein
MPNSIETIITMVENIGKTIETTVTMVENNGRTIGTTGTMIEEMITDVPAEIAMDEITTGANG